MRENKKYRTDVELYCIYEINGLNLDRFINTVRKRGIDLYDVKKYSNKRMRLAVKFSLSQNFFAIAEELCYNIKKVGEKGRARPLFSLLSSFGLVIGATIFIAVAILANDIVFDVCYSGTGKIYHREVDKYLESKGVKEYSKFSDIDLMRLEDGILASNDRLSFVSCKKKGNRLMIELVLSTEKVKALDGNVYQMVSDTAGEVESVKVYRGTAVVKVGDTVKVGDLLVDGFMTVKDQTVKTNVLASVTLIVDQTEEYVLSGDDQEEKAELFALSEHFEKEIISSQVEKFQTNEGYLYRVTLKYRRALCVG